MFKKSFATIFILSWMISLATAQAYDNVKIKTLLIFSADWCKYCQVAKDDLNKDKYLSEAVKKYEVIILDYDLDKDAFSGYNIKTLPTFIILEDKKEVKRQIGYKGGKEELNRFLK